MGCRPAKGLCKLKCEKCEKELDSRQRESLLGSLGLRGSGVLPSDGGGGQGGHTRGGGS